MILIFAIVSFISFSFISALVFLISFLLLTLGFFVCLFWLNIGFFILCKFDKAASAVDPVESSARHRPKRIWLN